MSDTNHCGLYSSRDLEIWQEELESFVPARVFEAHAHIYRVSDYTHYPYSATYAYPTMNVGLLNRSYGQVMPGREMHYHLFGYPASENDFASANAFTAGQAELDPLSVASMLVRPEMGPELVSEETDKHGFVGLKPYPGLVDPVPVGGVRIRDMLPERLVEIANERGLVVMLHLPSRGVYPRKAIAQESNISDLEELSARYPCVRWILAHCGRAWTPWIMERAIDRLKAIPNTWLDTSYVCASETFEIVFSNLPHERILFAADAPLAFWRGKSVWFGDTWIDFLGHPNATFVLYEQLRAMRHAAVRTGLTRAQVEDIFFNNAMRLFGLSDKK